MIELCEKCKKKRKYNTKMFFLFSERLTVCAKCYRNYQRKVKTLKVANDKEPLFVLFGKHLVSEFKKTGGDTNATE